MAYRRGVRDIGDRDEAAGGFAGGGRGIRASEEDVEGLVGFEVGGKGREVGVKRGSGRGDDGAGDYGFVLDAGEEAALRGRAEEGLEGAVELRRSWVYSQRDDLGVNK